MSDSSNSERTPSFVGRLLYGGTLFYMGIDGFRHNDKRVEIARNQGVPFPEILVPLATGLILVSSLLLVIWVWPLVAAAATLLFFVSTTPSIHSFWEFEGEERANQKIHFLKNVALIGGAVILFKEALRTRDESD